MRRRSLILVLDALAGVLVVLALTLLLVRILLPDWGGLTGRVETYLSAVTGREVYFESLELGWAGWAPELVARGARISVPDGAPLQAQVLGVSFALGPSLRALRPRLKQIRLSGLTLQMQRTNDGSLFFHGWQIPRPADGGYYWQHLHLAPALLRVENVSVLWSDRPTGIDTGLVLERLELRQDTRGWRLLASGEMLSEAGGSLVLGLVAPAEASGQAQIYLELRELQLDYWLRQLLAGRDVAGSGQRPAAELEGQVDLRLWAGLDQGRFRWLQGEHETRLIPPASGRGKVQPLGHQFRWQAFAEHARTEWVARIPGSGSLRLDYPLSAPGGHGSESAPGLSLDLIDLDLAAYSGLAAGLATAGVPFGAPLLALEPRGRLTSLSWETRLPNPTTTDRLDVEVHDLALAAYAEWPGFAGLSGSLVWQQGRGSAVLDGRGMRLELPRVLTGPLWLENFQGELDLEHQSGQWTVQLKHLAAANPDLALTGSGELRVAEGTPWLDLDLAFLRGDGNQVARYLPYRWLDPELRDWLIGGIQAGRVVGGGLQLRGDPKDFPFVRSEGLFQATVEVVDGLLDYHPGWPPARDLTGTLVFVNNSFSAQNIQGQILGSEIVAATVQLTPIGEQQPVTLSGMIQGPATDLIAYLEATGRAAEFPPGSSETLKMTTGRTELQLDLTLPVTKAPGAPTFHARGALDLHAVSLLWSEWPVPIEAVEGRIEFDTRTGFRAEALQLQLFGEPLRVSGQRAGDGRLELFARGPQPLEPWLQGYLGLPDNALAGISGQAVWEVELRLAGPDASFLRARSDLEGIQLQWPAPLAKTRGVRRDFELYWPLQVTQMTQASLRIRDQVSADLRVGPRSAGAPAQPLSLRLLLGGPAELAAPPLPLAGSVVHADLDTFDLEAWQRFLAPLFERVAAAGVTSVAANARPAAERPFWLPLRGDIQIRDSLRWRDQHFSGLRARLEWQGDAPPWIWVDSDWLEGDLRLEPDPGARLHGDQRVVRIALARLQLPQWPPQSPAQSSAQSPAHSAPRSGTGDHGALEASGWQWPAVDLAIADLRVGPVALQAVQLQLEPELAALVLTGQARLGPDTVLTAQGRTTLAGAGATRVRATLEGTDWGAALATTGLSESLEGGTGTAQVVLRWPGLPWQWNLEQLEGQLELELRDARLRDVEPGAGRVLGLVSFDLIPQRLRLDFRDVYSAGFGIDEMTAAAELVNGDLLVSELVMTGRSAVVRMTGRTGLIDRSLEHHVVVVPRLRSTLPIVGALVGGPVAGAVVLVVERVLGIGDQIEEAARVEYEVSGSWSNPVVRARVRVDGDVGSE